MNKFLIRTLSGAVYVAIVVCSIFLGKWTDNTLLGNAVFACVFFVIGIIGIYEYVHNLELKGVKSNKPMAFIAGVASYFAFFVLPLASETYVLARSIYLFVSIIFLSILIPVLYLTTFIISSSSCGATTTNRSQRWAIPCCLQYGLWCLCHYLIRLTSSEQGLQ